MPNHVYSHVKFSGDQAQIDALLAGAASVDAETGEPFINFSKLYPCPPELTATVSPVRIVSEEEYAAETERLATLDKPDPLNCGRAITAAMRADYLQRFGVDNWYDWCCRYWGTKWGTYCVKQVAPNEYHFETAWSPASGLWERISELFPAVRIKTAFVDEGEGFYGRETYFGGEVVETVNGGDRDEIGELVGCPRYTDEEEFDEELDAGAENVSEAD